MLFKEFYKIDEVSTCGDLKALGKEFAYEDYEPKYLGNKLGEFQHTVNNENIIVDMYEYNYDEYRVEKDKTDAYIWIDRKNNNKIAHLSYISLKVKLENIIKVISEKYFFVVEAYRGNRLITPIYEQILDKNTVSPGKIVSDVKQSSSMNKFWKQYLIKKYKADVLISTRIGSNFNWVLVKSPEGKKEIEQLIYSKKLIMPNNFSPLNPSINGDEAFNNELFRILVRK